MLYKLSIIEINVRINTESYCFHLVSYLYLMYQNFLACAVEVCVKFSFQWKVWEKLSTIKFLTGEEYDWIYFTCCTKILHDQCSVLLFIRLFTFLTNNPSLALIGRNPFRACFHSNSHSIMLWSTSLLNAPLTSRAKHIATYYLYTFPSKSISVENWILTWDPGGSENT